MSLPGPQPKSRMCAWGCKKVRNLSCTEVKSRDWVELELGGVLVVVAQGLSGVLVIHCFRYLSRIERIAGPYWVTFFSPKPGMRSNSFPVAGIFDINSFN